MSDSDHRILVIASGDAARCAEAAAAAVGAGCVRVDSRVPDGLDPGPWSTVLLAGEISSAVLDGMRDRLGSVPDTADLDLLLSRMYEPVMPESPQAVAPSEDIFSACTSCTWDSCRSS